MESEGKMEKEYVPAKGEVEEYLKCQNLKYENKGNNQLLLTPCPFCGGGKGEKARAGYGYMRLHDAAAGRGRGFEKDLSLYRYNNGQQLRSESA